MCVCFSVLLSAVVRRMGAATGVEADNICNQPFLLHRELEWLVATMSGSTAVT